MALSRTDISDGLITELGNLEHLVRSLSQAELDTPSRCAGWTAGDVARHAIGGMVDVTAGRLDGLGSPEVTAREVTERAGHSASQLADECAAVATAAAGLLSIFDDTAWAGPQVVATTAPSAAASRRSGTTAGCTATTSATPSGNRLWPATACAPRYRMWSSSCASSTAQQRYPRSTTRTRSLSSSPRPAAPTGPRSERTRPSTSMRPEVAYRVR